MIAWLVVVFWVSCFDAAQRLMGMSTVGGGVMCDLELWLGHATWVWMDEFALRVDLFDMLPRMTKVVGVTVCCWGAGRLGSMYQLILCKEAWSLARPQLLMIVVVHLV